MFEVENLIKFLDGKTEMELVTFGQREGRIEILWTVTNSIRKKTREKKEKPRKNRKNTAENSHIVVYVTNSQTIYNKCSWAEKVALPWD